MTIGTEENFAQEDLHYLLPLRKGQTVMVMGDAPGLLNGIHKCGVTSELLAENFTLGRLDQSFISSERLNADHIFILSSCVDDMMEFFQEIGLILKTDGWVFFAFPNAQRLQRFRFWKKKNSSSESLKEYSLVKVLSALKKTGFKITGIYGLQDSLQAPQYFIPLEDASASRFFFSHIALPDPKTIVLFRILVRLLTAFNMQYLLFRDLAIVAQAPASGENDHVT